LSRALPVGVGSLCEYADVELDGPVEMEDLLKRLNDAAPEGIRFAEVRWLDDGDPSLDRDLISSRFEIEMEGSLSDAAERAVGDFAAEASFPIEIERKGKKREIDLKEAITDLAVAGDNVIVLTLSHAGPSVKVTEALHAIVPDSGVRTITKVEMTLCQMN
jgi:radical SAM-linked protein